MFCSGFYFGHTPLSTNGKIARRGLAGSRRSLQEDGAGESAESARSEPGYGGSCASQLMKKNECVKASNILHGPLGLTQWADLPCILALAGLSGDAQCIPTLHMLSHAFVVPLLHLCGRGEAQVYAASLMVPIRSKLCPPEADPCP